jgi:hypothetical protein
MPLASLPESPLLIALLAVAGFAAVWAAISSLIAAVSGWRLLAQVYPLTTPFNGQRWRFRSARMRWATNYSGCLTIGANVRGLYLGVLYVFRIGHPPVFVPWPEVRMTVHKGRIFRYLDFTFARAPGVVVGVDERVARNILQAGRRSPPVEGDSA